MIILTYVYNENRSRTQRRMHIGCPGSERLAIEYVSVDNVVSTPEYLIIMRRFYIDVALLI